MGPIGFSKGNTVTCPLTLFIQPVPVVAAYKVTRYVPEFKYVCVGSIVVDVVLSPNSHK